MPLWQVTLCELVYIDRTYEVDAETATLARRDAVARGTLVNEQIQDTYSLERVSDAVLVE